MKVYHWFEHSDDAKYLVSSRHIGNWYADGQPPLKPTISEEVRDQYFKSPYKIAEDGYIRFKQDTIISKLKKQFEEENQKEKEKAMFNDVKVLYDGHSYRPTAIQMIGSAREAPVLRIECPVGYVAYHAVTPKKPEPKFPEIKKVIFNNPATIVLWEDGTKTVVKCENEEFDPEKGLAMAITKKVLGNNGHYFETIKKWTRDWYTENVKNAANKLAGEEFFKGFEKAVSDFKKYLNIKSPSKNDISDLVKNELKIAENEVKLMKEDTVNHEKIEEDKE